jgi:hypothetical protein
MIFMKIVVFLGGLLIVLSTLAGATRTFVLPRGENVRLTRFIFRMVRRLFDLRMRFAKTYEDRDKIMALYAPTALLVTPIVWLALVLVGYMGMFWGVGIDSVGSDFFVSGSSLLTLGFAQVNTPVERILAFTEATIGLGLVALLIAYLPTMYNAFSRRETQVALLEVYASSPPTAQAIISRIYRIHGLAYLGELWSPWELWFAEVEESHTSLAALSFFRSPTPERSWVTAAGTVLDAASLAASTLDIPPDPRANLCIRAGYLALRRIAGFFRIPFDDQPKPTDPISIKRTEFDEVYNELAKIGVPLKADRDQAWHDFSGWRINYDRVLLALAELTMAPRAPWTSDRPPLPLESP